MSEKEYQINDRMFTAFAPIEQELPLTPGQNHLFELLNYAVISVQGEKSSEFLQGQLTCDVRDIHSHQMRQGAMCNLKGRILALLDIVDWQGFHLVLPSDLLTPTLASLSKTAMLSRVTLKTMPQYRILGFHLGNNEGALPFEQTLPAEKYHAVSHAQFCCYALGKNTYVFIVEDSLAISWLTFFRHLNQLKGSLAWQALQLQQHRVEIYPSTRGLFLPHRLGLQLTSYLSFNKGCYKGQEIIARTHYRAKLKHQLQLFIIECKEPLHSGQLLLSPDKATEIGELVDYCPLGSNAFLIAASVVLNCSTTACLGQEMVNLNRIDG